MGTDLEFCTGIDGARLTASESGVLSSDEPGIDLGDVFVDIDVFGEDDDLGELRDVGVASFLVFYVVYNCECARNCDDDGAAFFDFSD